MGISPGIADGSAADLESDPLEIEYIATRNGTGGFNVTSFKVTNLTTAQVFTYNKAIRTFNWYATDPEVDPYLDAFFAQQLATNNNAAFSGRTDGVKVEYLPAPPSRSVFDFHFTEAEGFTTNPLSGQNGWTGQAANVDATGTGTVAAGTYTRNMYNNGLLGSSAGNPATALEEITIGESVEVVVEYQFVLPSAVNNNLGFFGFRTEGPNAENGYNSGPKEGFAMRFNGFNGSNTGGLLQVFPDKKDEAEPVDLANALLISGNDVGIDPFDDLGNGVDLTSDRLRFTYTLLIDEQDPLGNDGVWDGLFVVSSLKVENLDTSAVFNYSGPTQNIFWNDTADEDGFAFEPLIRSLD